MKLKTTVFSYSLAFALALQVVYVFPGDHQSKKIAVIGTGYVGLVTGVGLSMKHNVVCCDIDKNKIELLNNGLMPIVEEGLESLVLQNVSSGRLRFSSNVDASIQDADIIFIAVGTPMADEGQADLSAIKSVAKTIGKNLNNYKVIVTKSTVPIGTGSLIKNIIADSSDYAAVYDIVSNPEFLREGQAVYDFLNPDRIVIGATSKRAHEVMQEVYEPWLEKAPIVLTNVETAEAIKYASNAFLAVKISFINEFANLCDVTDVDVATVSKAMGLDTRIGSQFLKAGPGYGGSCFPKDTQALAYIADQQNIDLHVVKAAIAANDNQRSIICKKIDGLLSDVKKSLTSDVTIALLGLTFKANTDDIRYSPSIEVIEYLRAKGFRVKAYDPEGMPNMKKLFPEIEYTSSANATVQDADMVIVMTDWDEFKNLDLAVLAQSMKGNAFLDARNIWNPEVLRHHGFVLKNFGRK